MYINSPWNIKLLLQTGNPLKGTDDVHYSDIANVKAPRADNPTSGSTNQGKSDPTVCTSNLIIWYA